MADAGTPGLLNAAALALLGAAAALVFYVPDDNTVELVSQARLHHVLVYC